MSKKGSDDALPLVWVKTKKPSNADNFCRTMSCAGEPETNALKFLLDDDQSQMRSLLADVCPLDDEAVSASPELGKAPLFPLPDSHWLNRPYGAGAEQGFKTLLHLAIERGMEDMVMALLEAGARADLFNERTGKAPIHAAAENRQGKAASLVSTLLSFKAKRPKINVAQIGACDRNGHTALHIAAEKGDLGLLKALLQRKELIEIDPQDLLGRQTPLYLAAKKGNADACRLLIENGANTKAVAFKKTAAEVMADNMPDFDLTTIKILQPRVSPPPSVLQHLDTLIELAQRNLQRELSNAQNHHDFSVYVQQQSVSDLNVHSCGGGMTLMQKASAYGLHLHVRTMLANGMDARATGQEPSEAVLLAAAHGFHQVLQVFKDHHLKGSETRADFSVLEKKANATPGESVLHWVLKMATPEDFKDGGASDFKRCFDVIAPELDRSAPLTDFSKEVTRRINHKDEQKLTPLHYAAQNWSQATVRRLLELGSNVGMRDLYDVTPISLILPETMEDFLNGFCLTDNGHEITDEKFELTFDYSFLAPPVDDPRLKETDPEGQKLVEKAALPETESLWYMSQSKEHRRLLDHPVIMSFLYLKWQRIRGYFNRNLRFYLMFVVCLSWYIFERFGGISYRMTQPTLNNETKTSDECFNQTLIQQMEAENEPIANSWDVVRSDCSFCSHLYDREEFGQGFWYIFFLLHMVVQSVLIFKDWYTDCSECNVRSCFQLAATGWVEAVVIGLAGALGVFGTQALWYVMTALMALLMLRELFQMSASVKRYVLSLENILEVAMISLVGYLLWSGSGPDDDCNLKRHLAAIAIVLSWAELIILVAKHPRISRYNVYVTMFYKVMKTFLYFLAWYSFFLVAFGFGFYIMLHRDVPGVNLEDSEYTFFNYPWLTLVKTSTMFVGEIEFADIPINLDSGLSQALGYLFLICFVFLIVVVLMNLLNGLAVSDTGIIREKAKIMSAKSRVETISYIESLMLGDPFDFLSSWPPFRWIQAIPSLAICRCLYNNKAVRDVSHAITGVTGILLFYTMLPNKKFKVHPNKRVHACGNNAGCCRCEAREMSQEVIRAAKAIVRAKKEEERRAREQVEKEGKEGELKVTVKMLEEKINKMMAAFNIK